MEITTGEKSSRLEYPLGEASTHDLSIHDRTLFEIVNFVFICGTMGMFGIVANIVNIIVFCKQGFNNTANIAFLGLAVSDICCLLTLEWSSVCMNPLFATFDVPWVPVEVMYLSAAWPHICFCRITSYITVYITIKRYLSIALPLKVKQIFTPRATTTAVCFIYILNLVTFIPEYASAYLDWTFVAEHNRTLFAIVFTSSRKNLQGLSYVTHSLFSTTSFVGVIIFTLVLMTKLRQTSALRTELTSAQDPRGIMPARDKQMVKMIVLIASAMIVCYTPGAIVSMATFAVGPEFNIKGRYINMCVSMWSIAYSFQTLNSSINIILYYKMSSKFRQTFHEVFKTAALADIKLKPRNEKKLTKL